MYITDASVISETLGPVDVGFINVMTTCQLRYRDRRFATWVTDLPEYVAYTSRKGDRYSRLALTVDMTSPTSEIRL